ncbi:MAG: nickel pincer cofactor biosynthesis protein LarC [Actinomycetota bacterium]|nr:nickel pincer cofactor biosynthesis protein LarC [Actinomycetota bacterium]
MTSASGRIGWVDAGSGASGDMLLGAVHDALVTLGLDPAVMARAAAAVVPVDITVTHEQRVGFQVARAQVGTSETSAPHRTWQDIRGLVEGADLTPAVRTLALQTFERLARAEAQVHGVTPEEIHFHEVGAHDAIGDIVGVCAGFVALDLATLHVSTIALGGGHAMTSHGPIPIPGPAVLELLRHSDLDAHGGPVDEELCTPTGAALLTTLAAATGPMPPMTVRAIGLGAGTRHTGVGLSALRLVIGEPAASASDEHDGVVIETNVDDLDPRLWPGVLQRLLDAGASDAWLTPILMKKGRPAHTLHVLVGPNAVVRQQIRNIVLTETSAIGLRETAVTKTALARREYVVQINGQQIRVKVALDATQRVVNVQPEYDDIAAAALALGRPAKQLLAEALAAAQTPLGPPPEDTAAPHPRYTT